MNLKELKVGDEVWYNGLGTPKKAVVKKKNKLSLTLKLLGYSLTMRHSGSNFPISDLGLEKI